jgi:hypothetical protein
MARRSFNSIDEFWDWLDQATADRLDRQKVFAAGNWTALYDALAQAHAEGADPSAPVALPRWVAEGMLGALPRIIREGFKPQSSGKRGRPRRAQWNRDIWRQDMIDWKRFLEVWHRRIARDDDLPAHPTPTEQRAQRIAHRKQAKAQGSRYRVHVQMPYPWQSSSADGDSDVFEAAADVLQGSVYEGSPAEIRHSWERVTAAVKAGEGWRYYQSRWILFDKRQSRNIEMFKNR